MKKNTKKFIAFIIILTLCCPIYADNASMYMVTSNWGARETYDFNTWVDGSSIYRDAIYFK